MISLEYKNKLGVFGSFILCFSNFIAAAMILVRNHFFFTSILYVGSNIVGLVALFISLIVLFAFVKDFFKSYSIITLMIGGTFAVWSFGGTIYSLIIYQISNYFYYEFYNIYEWLTVLAVIVLFALISLKLLKTDGIGRLIGLGGFVYILIYLANFIINFLTFYDSLFLAIITLIFDLVPYILLLSYFLFVENE